MRTAGQLLMDTPFSDAQIFLGADDFALVTGTRPVISQGTLGLPNVPITANATTAYAASLGETLRTGTAPNYQQQFGTAASVPGPSSVPNTSDPLGLQGFPPIKAANLPTIKGPVTGFLPKGTQINWVDLVYVVSGAALTSASVGITAALFVNNVAPVVNNILTFGTNGLPTATQVQPYVFRVLVPTPAFIVSPDTNIVLNVQFVAPVGETGIFYGASLGVSYNYN